jgi:hypothetical protein
MADARQFTALQMLASGIDVSVSIPRRVFAPEFNDVFVMDFAWLIDRRAVDLMKMLIRVAGPTGSSGVDCGFNRSTQHIG